MKGALLLDSLKPMPVMQGKEQKRPAFMLSEGMLKGAKEMGFCITTGSKGKKGTEVEDERIQPGV